jgi:hypothetical protein
MVGIVGKGKKVSSLVARAPCPEQKPRNKLLGYLLLRLPRRPALADSSQ